MYASILSLNLALGKVGGQRHAPVSLFPGNRSGTPLQEGRWPPESLWTGAENLDSAGIRSTVLPARSESLYRLQFPGTLYRKEFFLSRRNSPQAPRPPHYRGFTITLRGTTVGRTSLDEWSARHRDLYQSTYNTTHKRQTSMLPTGLETTIPARKQPQTHALDRTAVGIGRKVCYKIDK